MIKSFEDLQTMNKDSIEAFAASSAALAKGGQALAQEVANFSRKSFEKSAAVFQSAITAKSFEKVVEVQQAFTKESFDAGLAEFARLSELYTAAAKSAFSPYEAAFGVGVKVPVGK